MKKNQKIRISTLITGEEANFLKLTVKEALNVFYRDVKTVDDLKEKGGTFPLIDDAIEGLEDDNKYSLERIEERKRDIIKLTCIKKKIQDNLISEIVKLK